MTRSDAWRFPTGVALHENIRATRSGANLQRDPFMELSRRDFLKTMAASSVGFALGGLSFSTKSYARIMTTAALRTGKRATFDAEKQEVLAVGKVFKY